MDTQGDSLQILSLPGRQAQKEEKSPSEEKRRKIDESIARHIQIYGMPSKKRTKGSKEWHERNQTV